MPVTEVTRDHRTGYSDGMCNGLDLPVEADSRKEVVREADADQPHLGKSHYIDHREAQVLPQRIVRGRCEYEHSRQDEGQRHRHQVSKEDRNLISDDEAERPAHEHIDERRYAPRDDEADKLRVCRGR